MSNTFSPSFDEKVALVAPETYEAELKRILGRHDGNVEAYLEGQFRTEILDEIYDHLWRVTTSSHEHIDALHEHGTKRREILVTEDPGMHLVWYSGLVFIKPIPEVLLSKDFWATYLPSQKIAQKSMTPAIVGFLRTYALLIDSKSDFVVAQRENLIPAEIAYHDFQPFIDQFRNVPDECVADRYHYGQMRLTRLNWAVRLLQPASAKSRFSWYCKYYCVTWR